VSDDFAADARWSIELLPADAIALFDWLMTVDFSTIPVHHRAHKQALTDLLAALETQAPVAGISQAQIDRALSQVSKDMGWP
jgi:hypothetical protein